MISDCWNPCLCSVLGRVCLQRPGGPGLYCWQGFQHGPRARLDSLSNVWPNSALLRDTYSAPVCHTSLQNLNLTFQDHSKDKCDGTVGIPIHDFLWVFNSNIWPNSAPFRDTRSKCKCHGAVGLPICDFLLVSVINHTCICHCLAVIGTLNFPPFLIIGPKILDPSHNYPVAIFLIYSHFWDTTCTRSPKTENAQNDPNWTLNIQKYSIYTK